MKKYKLIKEYPGSPKLGVIWDENSPDCVKYPEFWEEVTESPDYVKCIKDVWSSGNEYLNKIFEVEIDILGAKFIRGFCVENTPSWSNCFIPATKKEYEAQIRNYQILIFKHGEDFSSLRENGRFVAIGLNPENCPDGKGATEKQMRRDYSPNVLEIFSIKRLSDGEIFTIGDIITHKNLLWDNNIKIKEFQVKNNNIVVRNSNSGEHNLNKLIKRIKFKKPLFITEDGVDLYEGDDYYRIVNWNISTLTMGTKFFNSYAGAKFFSTKEKAEEYVEIHKPQYSLADLRNILNNPRVFHSSFFKFNGRYI